MELAQEIVRGVIGKADIGAEKLLVENGLTHGYVGKDVGVFILSRNEVGNAIHYTLYNDGVAGDKDKVSESSGLGLKYVRARLEEAYGRSWQLDSHAVAGGWEVTIAIRKEADPYSPPGERHPATFTGSALPA